jgi:hypothetical protein
MIAALYVQKDGAYYGLPDVDPWDEERDARLYEGPWSVIAHPPCQRWCQLAPLNESRLGDGYAVGDDGGCFAAALEAVRKWGGVLEHPAYSYAWPAFGLPRPTRHGWTRTPFDEGWVTEVSQSAYGHECRKRTWLYYVGESPVDLDYSEPLVHAQVSAFGRSRRSRPLLELDKGKSAYTPEAFREVLLHMARFSRRSRLCGLR